MTVRITYQKALEMMKDEKSLLALNTRQEHIALQPKFMGNLKDGVKAILDSYMLLYQERFDGVPMAYNNIRMVQHAARKIAYQPYLHFDINVDFIVFKPQVDCCLKGVIQKVEKSHISCLVHGVFNAWCPKDPLLNSIEDPNPLALIGSEIELKVKKLSSSNGVLSIRGKFQKILKKKSIQIETNSQSTPLNKKVNFDSEEEDEEEEENNEEEGDTHDSPDMDRSFCPALTSTQIETPYISTKQGRKRKLSEVIEAHLSNELSNSGEIEMDNNGESNSYTKLKKKKRKKEKHDMEVSKQTETEESLDDKVPDTSKSKHKKKKKHKHKDRRDS